MVAVLWNQRRPRRVNVEVCSRVMSAPLVMSRSLTAAVPLRALTLPHMCMTQVGWGYQLSDAMLPFAAELVTTIDFAKISLGKSSAVETPAESCSPPALEE